MSKIIMPKNITEIEIEKIIEEFLVPAYSTHLDFINTDFISPFAAILLTLLFESATKKSNRKIHMILSRTSRIKPCMYILARLGFFDNLPKIITYYPYKPKFKRNFKGKNDAILELTRIQEPEASIIIDKVEKAIAVNTDYPKEHKLDICLMVSEMIQNIFYHSTAPKSGIIAIQNFERFNYMQIIIADSGIGIPETINRCKDYKDKQLKDYEAILESVKKGVSSLGKVEDRGEGLSRCVDLSNKHNAKLFIRSNSGYASITFKNERAYFGNSDFLAGTQIFVNFPCS